MLFSPLTRSFAQHAAPDNLSSRQSADFADNADEPVKEERLSRLNGASFFGCSSVSSEQSADGRSGNARRQAKRLPAAAQGGQSTSSE
jgi:hypothetical protein